MDSKHLSYAQWLATVEEYVWEALSCSVDDDIPNFPARDCYDAGVTPFEAIEVALEYIQ